MRIYPVGVHRGITLIPDRDYEYLRAKTAVYFADCEPPKWANTLAAKRLIRFDPTRTTSVTPHER